MNCSWLVSEGAESSPNCGCSPSIGWHGRFPTLSSHTSNFSAPSGRRNSLVQAIRVAAKKPRQLTKVVSEPCSIMVVPSHRPHTLREAVTWPRIFTFAASARQLPRETGRKVLRFSPRSSQCCHGLRLHHRGCYFHGQWDLRRCFHHHGRNQWSIAAGTEQRHSLCAQCRPYRRLTRSDHGVIGCLIAHKMAGSHPWCPATEG